MSPRRGLRLTGRETQETRRQPAGSRAQEVFCPERTRLFSVSTSSRRPGKRSRLDTKSDSAEIMCGSVTSFCPCSGGSHHRKQELVKELQRNGVNFDVRKLNVGDFLWVAREKVAPVPGNGRQKLEETQQKTQTRLTVNTFSELRSRYNLIVSVSRSAARPRSPGARPRLRHREEEDGRPLRQHHRRTLQGTEGGAFLLELYMTTYRYLSDKIAKSFSSFLSSSSQKANKHFCCIDSQQNIYHIIPVQCVFSCVASLFISNFNFLSLFPPVSSD